jgi:futalosine hydrolase
MIALISSVPEEGKLFIRQLQKKSVVGGKPLCRGRIHDKHVIYVVSGAGKVNAAHAATILLEKFSPDEVILFGIGGAYLSSGLSIGDIAVAEKEVYGDEGVQVKEGFRGTDFIGIPLMKKGGKKYFNEFPLNAKLVDKVMRSLDPGAQRSSFIAAVKAGIFVTVSACSGTREMALERERRFSAICENMEGASVAHICTLYGTPFAEIRGISNMVDDRDRAKWNIGLAADNCQKAIMEVLKNL